MKRGREGEGRREGREKVGRKGGREGGVRERVGGR